MKICIATGGTGGHIYPALRLAKHLRDSGHAIIVVGDLGKMMANPQDMGFKVIAIDAARKAF